MSRQSRPRPATLLVGVLVALAAQSCVIPPPEERLQVIGKAAPAALDPASIRVLVWNIYKSAKDGWWPDMQRLAARHDLLLLQEGAWDEPLRAQYRQLAASGALQLWLGVAFVRGLRVVAGSAQVLSDVSSSDHVPLSFEVATTDRAPLLARRPRASVPEPLAPGSSLAQAKPPRWVAR